MHTPSPPAQRTSAPIKEGRCLVAPVRFSPEFTNLIAATNNNDGTYTLTFDQPITNTNPGVAQLDSAFVALNTPPSAPHRAQFSAAETGNTIVITASVTNPFLTLITMILQPYAIASALPFNTAGPPVAIT